MGSRQRRKAANDVGSSEDLDRSLPQQNFQVNQSDLFIGTSTKNSESLKVLDAALFLILLEHSGMLRKLVATD